MHAYFPNQRSSASGTLWSNPPRSVADAGAGAGWCRIGGGRGSGLGQSYPRSSSLVAAGRASKDIGKGHRAGLCRQIGVPDGGHGFRQGERSRVLERALQGRQKLCRADRARCRSRRGRLPCPARKRQGVLQETLSGAAAEWAGRMGRHSPAQRLPADRVPEAEVFFPPLRVRAVPLENGRGGGRVGRRRRRRTGARRQAGDQDGQNSRSHRHPSFGFRPRRPFAPRR